MLEKILYLLKISVLCSVILYIIQRVITYILFKGTIPFMQLFISDLNVLKQSIIICLAIGIPIIILFEYKI